MRAKYRQRFPNISVTHTRAKGHQKGMRTQRKKRAPEKEISTPVSVMRPKYKHSPAKCNTGKNASLYPRLPLSCFAYLYVERNRSTGSRGILGDAVACGIKCHLHIVV
jgi:hypothetical protein